MIHQDEKDLRLKDRPFKRHYTVYRPDDPRIENLKARPQYYNPEGVIPDPLDTKPEYHGWQGKTSNPTMADGTYAKDISMRFSKPSYDHDHRRRSRRQTRGTRPSLRSPE